jgi:sugar-specific transcriptional regulator TrmB
MFESLGLDATEEAAYLKILSLESRSLAAIARALRISPSRLRVILERLEEKGLITQTPGKRPTFYATPPETAVEVLILRRREEMERARVAAAQLQREALTRGRSFDPLQLVEVLTGAEAADQRFQQLQLGLQQELLAFSKPPYISPVDNTAEIEVLKRGVRYRILYESATFEVPGAIESIEASVVAGEEARVLPELPMKLILMDKHTAFMPLNLEQPYETAVLVVHGSAIVAALATLFEMLWEKAVPFGQATSGKPARGEETLGERDRRLVSLLAAGMKDSSIARELGHDPRTVRRLVRSLMDEIGASTRFQAGLQIARRGWI